MRLFVAVVPPDPTVAAVAALPRPAIQDVRWTTPDQWHVTLVFLGEVPEEDLGSVEAAVEAAARRGAPAQALLGPATTRFGRAVLGVPVDGLAGLARAVRAALADAGVEVPDADRPYRGHCTLARARHGRAIPSSLAGVPINAKWTAEAMCLVRSTLDPQGARYETILSATVPS